MPRLRTRSVGWVLSLLALRHGREVERNWLAGTLWPESAETNALNNLRADLMYLRRALGPEADRLQSPSRDRLVLDLTDATADVAVWDAAVKTGDAASLTKAVELYTGPLLEGCLEEWAIPERERRAGEYLVALEKLADDAESRADAPAAIAYLRKAEARDNLRDSTQRRLMRVLAASGDVPAATYAYREFRSRLHRELNAEPDPETTELFRQIRTGARISLGPRPATPQTAATTAPVADPAPTFSVPATARVPHPLTRLIGRECEVAEIASQLALARLVSLVGGGGLGKTRLSIEVAHGWEREGLGAVAFVTLAALSEGDLLPSLMASQLNASASKAAGADQLLQAVATKIGDAPLLLVMDNCEHLIEPAAQYAQALLERCPKLRILATSRQRLDIPGEIVWRVPTLGVPDEKELMEALEFPAVQMFLERAAMVRPGYQPADHGETAVVAQICRRLDGIPLALELAAAQTMRMTVAQVAEGLDDRFRLLSGGNRGTLPRHRTLRTLIDWSHDLLDETQRTLLRRLSVFSGGWTFDAAERVTAPVGDLLGVLVGLVDQSLVQEEAREGRNRFHFLETIREYALERLSESGEEPALRSAHGSHFLALAEEARLGIEGPEQPVWLKRVDAEYDNLRAALAWFRQAEDGACPGVRLARSLYRYWSIRGLTAEGRDHLRAALARDFTNAGPEVQQARAGALANAGTLALDQGDHAAAWNLMQESFDVAKTLGRPEELSRALNGFGNILSDQGRLAEARDYYLKAVAAVDREANPVSTVMYLNNVGFTTFELGDHAGALRLYHEALGIARKLGNPRSIAMELNQLARAALEIGDVDAADGFVRESLTHLRPLGDSQHTIIGLELAAATRVAGGDARCGMRLYGASQALRESARFALGCVYRPWHERLLNAGRAALGSEAFERAVAEGAALTIERALEEALGAA